MLRKLLIAIGTCRRGMRRLFPVKAQTFEIDLAIIAAEVRQW